MFLACGDMSSCEMMKWIPMIVFTSALGDTESFEPEVKYTLAPAAMTTPQPYTEIGRLEGTFGSPTSEISAWSFHVRSRFCSISRTDNKPLRHMDKRIVLQLCYSAVLRTLVSAIQEVSLLIALCHPILRYSSTTSYHGVKEWSKVGDSYSKPLIIAYWRQAKQPRIWAARHVPLIKSMFC